MLNQTILVGRLVLIEEDENVIITISVPRNFKNDEGKYDVDRIKCLLVGLISKTTKEQCKANDIIGVKGRIQTNEDGTMIVVAERITFLSSSKEEIDSE